MLFFYIIGILLLIALGTILIPNLIDEPVPKKSLWDSPGRLLLVAIVIAIIFWILSNLWHIDPGFRW